MNRNKFSYVQKLMKIITKKILVWCMVHHLPLSPCLLMHNTPDVIVLKKEGTASYKMKTFLDTQEAEQGVTRNCRI